MKRSYFAIFLLLAAIAGGCSRSEVKISGRFISNNDRQVYLEKILPGRQEVVDSTVADGEGNFALKARLDDGLPTIFYVMCRNERIPLLLSPGDRVKLHAIGGISRNYTVEGSEGSAKMRELKEILSSGAMTLDSLQVYDPVDSDERIALARKYAGEYTRIKNAHVGFISANRGSMVALYALYQRLPGDEFLANGANDIAYYQAVADTLDKVYPESPYVIDLKKRIANAREQHELSQLVDNKLTSEAVGYPDIELDDIYGKKQKLSSLDGKVILVSFWSVTASDAAMMNAELKELYEKFSGDGLGIYQISVDTDKAAWVNTVQTQRLPWTSVRDPQGASGVSSRSFSVNALPTMFLIDKQGNIVARDPDINDLPQKISGLLKQ